MTAPVHDATSLRERQWLALLAPFAAVSVVVLLLPAPALGLRVLGLVVAFHVALAFVATRPGADPWLRRAWAVLAPLSVLMVLPDWFLSDVLGVLSFPDTGGPFIGTVPLAMAGMWTIALLPIVGIALAVGLRFGGGAGLATAAGAGLALFLAAERLAPALPLWEPVGVREVAGVALYVLPAEVVLCMCAYSIVAARGMPVRATAALTALLPFTYLGLLATGYQFLG
jgi:hypothetical protein